MTGVAIIDNLPNREPGLYVTYNSSKVMAYLERSAQIDRNTRRFVAEFDDRCAAAGIRFTFRVETGNPVDVLLRLHEEFDVTLLPKESRFQFSAQDEPDDTLTQVLRKARRPVVAVPTNLPPGDAVVVAYDGEPAAVDALESFAESGLGVGLPVSVVAVAEDRETAEPRANEAARYLAAHDVRAEAHPVVTSSGHEADALHAAAEFESARMVVMGAYSHGRMREWFDRSTTTRMLKKNGRLLYLHHHSD